MCDGGYEHAGEWSCEACGETFEVETKLDPLSHALSCGDSTSGSRANQPKGFQRRQRELQEARNRV